MTLNSVLVLTFILSWIHSSLATLEDQRKPHLRIFLDGKPVELGFLNTTTRPRAAVSNDQAAIDKFESQGGKLEYQAPRNPGASLEDLQATGLTATITSKVIENAKDIGSCAYGNKKPPGFEDLKNMGACAHRGHLLAHMLGGSGKDVRNIVAVTDLVNNPHMKNWETKIRDAWNKNILSDFCTVRYKVTVSYQDPQKRPQNIRLSATLLSKDGDFESEWFDVNIRNDPLPSKPEKHEIDIVGKHGPSPISCRSLAPVCKKRKVF